MPAHAELAVAELHECKQIKSATTADAGKVVTPSSVTNNVGTLRNLLGTEIATNGTTADAGKVYTQSDTDDAEQEFRYLNPDDLENYKTSVQATFADIGTLTTEYAVAPHAVEDIQIRVVLYGAITGADETVSVTVGAATVVNLTVPIAGSGAGVVTSGTLVTLSAAQPAGSRITIATAGTSTGATKAVVVVGLQGQT